MMVSNKFEKIVKLKKIYREFTTLHYEMPL